MAGKQKKYNREHKLQAVKLSKEIGGSKAAGSSKTRNSSRHSV